MLLALVTLLALASADPSEAVPAESETERPDRFVRLLASEVRIQDDGRVLLVRRGDSDLAADLELLGRDHVSVVRYGTLLVDGRGIAWFQRGDRIVGEREGSEVYAYPLPDRTQVVDAATDDRGRVWFAARGLLLWFDGVRWATREAASLRTESARDRPSLATSSGGARVYAWTPGGEGFMEASGRGPALRTVDLRHGLAFPKVFGLVAIGADRVLTLPTFQLIDAGDRQEPSEAQVAARTDRHEPRTRVVGRFELANRPELVESRDGGVLIRASRCLDWRGPAPAPEGHGREIWRDHAPAELLIPHGPGVLIRVRDDGTVLRVSADEEAFGPTFVDRSGGLWRHDSLAYAGSSLARLGPDGASTLVDTVTGRPAAVQAFSGTDRSGRVYLKTGGAWFAFDAARPGVPNERLAWRTERLERWSIERETEAWALVREAFAAQDFARAEEVAEWYGRVAWIAPDRLARAERWADASNDLSFAVRMDAADRPPFLAHAAIALELDDEARRWIDIELDALRSRRIDRRPERAHWFAETVDALGDADRAIEAYGALLELQPDSYSGTLAACRCAARHLELDRAVEWTERLRTLAVTWQIDEADRQIAAIAALQGAKRDPAARVRFAREYWLAGGSPRWNRDLAIEAFEAILDEFDLEDGLDLDVHRTLMRLLLEDGRFDDAIARMDALESADRHGVDVRAALWNQVGGALRSKGMRERARSAYRRALAEERGACDHGRATRAARIALAALEHGDGNHDAAIELALPLLAWARRPENGNAARLDGTPRTAAFLLASCYEAKGDFEEALRHARTTLDEFRPSSGCGTCVGSMRKRSTDLVARLEAAQNAGR